MTGRDFAQEILPALHDVSASLRGLLTDRFPAVEVSVQYGATAVFPLMAFVTVRIPADDDFESVDCGIEVVRRPDHCAARWFIAREDGTWVNAGGASGPFPDAAWGEGVAARVAEQFARMVGDTSADIAALLAAHPGPRD